MPINELEIHPYLNSINDENYETNYFENLIIGTFPIYSITNTLNPDGTELTRFNDHNAFMRFYYGSKQNSFWKLFSTSLLTFNPTSLDQENRTNAAISLLIQNRFLITDIVFKTNRIDENSEDSELWVPSNDNFVNENRSLNTDIIRILNRNIGIKYLYFTSTVLNGNSPFGWFRELLGDGCLYRIIHEVENRVISASITINEREYIAFFLPSPAGNGTRGLHFNRKRTQIFVNYLQSVDPDFYNEINLLATSDRNTDQKTRLTQLRNNFLIESWRQVIVNKNRYFNGNI